MGMTSDQIKKSLKPMADFAPAVLAAAEIVASMEAAERGLTSLAEDRARLQREIEGLAQSRDAHQGEMAQLAAAVEKAKRSAATEMATLTTELGVMQGTVEAARATLEATRADHATLLQVQHEEFSLKRSHLDGLKHELAAFMAKHGGV